MSIETPNELNFLSALLKKEVPCHIHSLTDGKRSKEMDELIVNIFKAFDEDQKLNNN